MHSALQQQVRRTLSRHDLCPPGSRVLVGLSGGSDSVGLLLLLRDASAHGGFQLAGAAHFNHGARATSERDEDFCRDLTSRLDVPFVRDGADVRRVAETERTSFEDCARRLRYAFLHRAAQDLGADRVAVGHTRDDQAETFLLKLARGAGATGLGAVYPRRGEVIRPLLDVSREDVQQLAARARPGLGRGRDQRRFVQSAQPDSSSGPARAGRRLRRADTRPVGPCGRVGTRGRPMARRASRGPVGRCWGVKRPDCLEFDAAALLVEPAPLRRRLLLQAMRSMADGREIGLEHVESAVEVLRGERRGADVPGSRWELRPPNLVLYRQGRGSA